MWLIAYDSHRQHVCEEEDASWSREGVGSSLFHGADAVEAVLDDGFKEIKETGRIYVRVNRKQNRREQDSSLPFQSSTTTASTTASTASTTGRDG